MKQVAVVSGKGGTGKTTIAAMFYSIENCILADCDVDTPNLHILLKPKVLEKHDFVSAKKAHITEKCTSCGLCIELCRFDAIQENDHYFIDQKRCEGCAFCYYACPEKAIELKEVKTGEIYISKTGFGFFVHALLDPGEENSGKLVTEVKQKAVDIAKREGIDLVLIDAAAGIGCPVIASLTNTNLAIVVSEPTMSGLRDMKRAIELAKHFNIESLVVINKFDLNRSVTSKIEEYCKKNNLEIVGKIPFDENLIKQLSNLEFPFKGQAAEKIIEIWDKVKEVL